MEHVSCNLCGADNYVVLKDKSAPEYVSRSVVIKDKEGNVLNGRHVVCKNCGLVYITPRMTKEELEVFYAEEYRKIYNDPNSLKNEVMHAQNAFRLLLREIDRIEDHLDIGCSTGELLKLTGGCGIEPNIEHCEIAVQRGLRVENTALETYSPGRQFDTITMLNTLEHLLDPLWAVKKIGELLASEGHLLVSVPNLYNRLVRHPTDIFLSNAHLYTFSLAALATLAARGGLTPLKIYIIDENIGEKLYLLARKSPPAKEYAVNFSAEDLSNLIDHYQKWDEVWRMKQEILKMGFR
jgi:SAM-dependent methyltransferase